MLLHIAQYLFNIFTSEKKNSDKLSDNRSNLLSFGF